MKTIKLNARTQLDRMQLPPAFVVAVLIFIVAGGISAIGRYTAPQAVAVPTPALRTLILATRVPEPTPAPPTPDQQLHAEIAALRARVAELEARPAAAPVVEQQVIYVEQAVQPAAPTMEPMAIVDPDQQLMEPAASEPVLDQGDPACTGAADNTIAAGCAGMDEQMLTVANQN